MKKYLKLTFSILIIGTSLIPLLATALGLNSINLDRSSLSSMPALIKDNRINTSFTSEFDDFFTDQFSLRTFLISAYNEIYANIFKQSGNDKVIVGQQGFLFFEETLDDYLKVNQLSHNDLMRFNEILRIQSKFLQSKNISGYLMIVPNKATIYPEHMPSSFKAIGERSNLDRISEMDLNINTIDLTSLLIKQKSVYKDDLYHRQDSHWNNIGAAFGYLEMMKSLNKESLSLLDLAMEKKVDWQGDLARMLYPSKITLEHQVYFQLPNQFTFTKAIRTFEDIQIESINSAKEGRLIMFRDSFANALIPYISESFAQVNYDRTFPYDFRRIKELQSDALVMEIAERNINWYLQATPILEVEGEEQTIVASSLVSLKITVEQQKKSGLFYLNARFDDQKSAEKIIAVKLIHEGATYDAFPIYQDDDFEDDIIEYGFSIYTLNELDLNSLEIYVFMDNAWVKIINK
ncbi:MAG: hypothetical protein CVU85_00155 [Firmicutes bacterium HGW-Firmicutes-10]|jgi:hypothetical protein|nr:MAG: hypothetical protein CVU85_00155 [Firmicutes bacterium HGW-Firmicutes-10]